VVRHLGFSQRDPFGGTPIRQLADKRPVYYDQQGSLNQTIGVVYKQGIIDIIIMEQYWNTITTIR